MILDFLFKRSVWSLILFLLIFVFNVCFLFFPLIFYSFFYFNLWLFFFLPWSFISVYFDLFTIPVESNLQQPNPKDGQWQQTAQSSTPRQGWIGEGTQSQHQRSGSNHWQSGIKSENTVFEKKKMKKLNLLLSITLKST